MTDPPVRCKARSRFVDRRGSHMHRRPRW
jgi:hypothetical protein